MNNNLNRFVKAQERDYQIALREIKSGKKLSHWMWYIFPQLKGMGRSHNSNFYGIEDLTEAELYLKHPVLDGRLLEISHPCYTWRGTTPGK